MWLGVCTGCVCERGLLSFGIGESALTCMPRGALVNAIGIAFGIFNIGIGIGVEVLVLILVYIQNWWGR